MNHLHLPQKGAVESLSIRRKNNHTDKKVSFAEPIIDLHLSTRIVQQQAGSTTTSSSSQRPLQLLDVPNEILAHIFHFVDSPPPSHLRSLAKPEHDLTFSTYRPLKSLSLTNRHLRFLVLPLLYQHVRLDPYYLPSFLLFATRSGIARHITTVTAQLQGPCNHMHPAWWSRLLDCLPDLGALTILAAPHVFAELGQVPIETSHSWAFKIPYQTLTLSYEPGTSSSCSEHSTKTDDVLSHSSPRSNLLVSKPWTSLSVNESSHLPAYSTYEYFLKTPPSLLTSLYHRQRIRPQPANLLQPTLSPSTKQFFNTLVSFRYTAIFPFYNHVDEILKCVRQMKKLKRLFMKLCPEPDSSILQDELEHNGVNAGHTEGRIDVNDPWNEFETSYTLIPHTIIYLTTDGSLEWFQTDDVKMVGIRDTLIEDIDRRLDGLGCWSHVGDGVWQRDTSVKIRSGNERSREESRADDNDGFQIEGR